MLHVWIALFCLTGEDEPLGFAHPQFLKPWAPHPPARLPRLLCKGGFLIFKKNFMDIFLSIIF
jgi:hypothetical protein